MEGQASERVPYRFESPRLCPEFRPTEEEFSDSLGYIRKIQSQVASFGICKIIPPKNWKPPFAINPHAFHFVPRVMKLNELDAKARVRLAFLARLDKFWALQSKPLRIPLSEGRPLDLYRLHCLVAEHGGFEHVCRYKKWKVIQRDLGLTCKNVSNLRNDYERLLYPFDVYFSGALFDLKELETEKEQTDEHVTSPSGAASGRMASRRASSASSANQSLARANSVAVPILVAASNSSTSVEANKCTKEAADVGDDCEADMQSTVAESTSDGDPVSRRTRNELKRLQVFGAGPKMVVPGQLSAMAGKEDDVLCFSCGRGDREHLLLLCDTESCGKAYHTFCLIPTLNEVPRGEWRCPRCVAKQCSKPTEYGFEQSAREYTLQSFGEMADRFKTQYFKKPLHTIGLEEVEREFWRLVQSLDDDVQVEYGADLHALVLGSGFATLPGSSVANCESAGECDSKLAAERKRYAKSSWNLNNISIADKSVLRYVDGDVSGMKVPWCYAGMCFSCFCWHTEDHWTYSINYLHFGEPKTWYGVPADDAEKLERVMHQQAADLFTTHPDLMHQLTVTLNPNTLTRAGVRVCKAYQRAGEFIVTMPRSYHAGFNQGFNFAEAVNFTLAEWMPMGRACVEHYRDVKRSCVFSHDELVVNIASHCDEIFDFESLRCVQDDLEMLITCEWRNRERLDTILDPEDHSSAKRYEVRRIPISKLSDEERECDVCRTTCSLSMLVCSCVPVRDPEQCDVAAHTSRHARRAMRMGRMHKMTMAGLQRTRNDCDESESKGDADDGTVAFIKPRLVCLRCADQLRCPNCEHHTLSTDATDADNQSEHGSESAALANDTEQHESADKHLKRNPSTPWRTLCIASSVEELQTLRNRIACRFQELESGRRDLSQLAERLLAAEPCGAEKLNLDEIREYMEANARRFSVFQTEVDDVHAKLRAADKFREAVRELMQRRRTQTRNAPSASTCSDSAPALLKFEELQSFVDELFELPFRIAEGDSLKNLLKQIVELRERVRETVRTGLFKPTSAKPCVPVKGAVRGGLASAYREAQELCVRGTSFDVDMPELTYLRTYTAQLGWLSELCRSFGMKPSRFATLEAVEHAFLTNIDRFAARVSKSKVARTPAKDSDSAASATATANAQAAELETKREAEAEGSADKTPNETETPMDNENSTADISTKPKVKKETETEQEAENQEAEEDEDDEEDVDMSNFCCSLEDLDRLVRDANALVIDPCAYAARVSNGNASAVLPGKVEESDSGELFDFRKWPSTRVVKRCLQELDLLKFTASDHELQARTYLDAITAEQQKTTASDDKSEASKRLDTLVRPFPSFRVRVTDFEQLLTDNRYLPVLLPAVEQLAEIDARVSRVTDRLAELYDAAAPPYFDALETLVARLASAHVGFDSNSKLGATLKDLEAQYMLARAWKMRLARLFLGSAATCRTRDLLRVLLPPNLADHLPDGSRRRPKSLLTDPDATNDQDLDTDTKSGRTWLALDSWLAQRDAFAKILATPTDYDDTDGRHSEALARTYARMYERAVYQFRELRERNMSKADLHEQTGVVYCVCKRASGAGAMIQCELCRDWLHVRCVQSHLTCTLVQGILQRDATTTTTVAANAQNTQGSAAKVPSELSDTEIGELIGELCYVCPNCARTRRPRLADVVGHLSALQSITRVRMLEADALQSLVDRCVTFMKRVEQFRSVFPLAASSMRELRNRKRSRDRTAQAFANSGVDSNAACLKAVANGNGSGDDSVLRLEPNLRALQRALDELLFEGNLLEIGMDELDELWLLHQFVQRSSDRRPAAQSASDAESELESDELEVEPADDVQQLDPDRRAGESAAANASDAKRRADRAKLKVHTHLVGARRQRKPGKDEPSVKRARNTEERTAAQDQECKGDLDAEVDEDDDVDEADADDSSEECSAAKCRHPVGADIQWIQCDGASCQKWYHFVCVGLTSEPSDGAAYMCPSCTAEPAAEPAQPAQPVETVEAAETVVHSEIPVNTTFL